MTCLLLITLKAHWLRCFTAASCFKTLQSPKNSLRHLGITARRPSGSCCKRHLHTFHALHFGENVDPCVFFLKRSLLLPAAAVWGNVLQVHTLCPSCSKNPKTKTKKNPKALPSLTGAYISPAGCIDRSRDAALLDIFNIFLQYFHHPCLLVLPWATGRLPPQQLINNTSQTLYWHCKLHMLNKLRIKLKALSVFL